MLINKSNQKGSALVLILVAFTTLALGIVGAYWYVNTNKVTTPPQPTQLNKVAVAQELFSSYLEKNKATNTPVGSRLTDYKIDKLDAIPGKTEDSFCFSVTYSVKPVSTNADWIAGNGLLDKSTGWINDKYAFVTVKKVSNEYIIDEIGTGGVCDNNPISIGNETDPLTVAKSYLDAYIKGDWKTAQSLNNDSDFNVEIAKSYGFTSYEIKNSSTDKNPNYFHIFIKLVRKSGVYETSVDGKPLEVLMYKNEEGTWKALTWYFLP